MPDKDGALSQEERKKVADWVNERRKGATLCPISGQTQWSIGKHVVAAVRYGGSIILGGSVYPLVQVICNDCGYTMLINAVKIGLLAEDKGEDEKQGDEDVS